MDADVAVQRNTPSWHRGADNLYARAVFVVADAERSLRYYTEHPLCSATVSGSRFAGDRAVVGGVH